MSTRPPTKRAPPTTKNSCRRSEPDGTAATTGLQREEASGGAWLQASRRSGVKARREGEGDAKASPPAPAKQSGGRVKEIHESPSSGS
uniref:Uncharacterized protein n=1 Tax=Arundo donax TaxID=35708 RepID=A0A0A9AJJ0_ARUDO